MDNPYDDNPMAGMSKKDKQNLQKKLTIKDKFDQRLYGQILLNIPKHLCRIFLFIGVISAITVVIMVLNDVKLEDFIASGEVMNFSKHRVHPLFGF
jgi:type III secretory pathway component EscU